jgi:flagellar protein FlaI
MSPSLDIMADLLTTSLRLRPDRVILGEIRTPNEAEVLFDAIHTGHSVSTTMHADTATQLIKRLLEPPFRISQTEIESLHLIIVQHRDRRRNIRRTFEISEIIPGAAGTLATNRLFIWRPRSDTFEKVNNPRRYIEEINLYTGMTEREIINDIEERKKILEWMIRKKYFELEKISEVARYYYNMYDELMEKVENDKELEEPIEEMKEEEIKEKKTKKTKEKKKGKR